MSVARISQPLGLVAALSMSLLAFQTQAQTQAPGPIQSPYRSPYTSPYQAMPAVGSGITSPPQAAAPTAAFPVQTYTIWYPRQVQLHFQPQMVTIPRWQLQPAEIKQPYSYVAPHYRQMTLVGYRPRVVLDPVEIKTWQVEWQRREAERRLQVWQPQLVQQPVQVYHPQWRVVPIPGQ